MTDRGCLHCNISSGRVPAYVVYEDEDVVAFLATNPIRPGHSHVVPKQHYSCFDDLPPALLAKVILVGQRIAKALKSIYSVKRVGFAFVGGDIQHAYAHVVPLVAHDDMTSRRYIVEQVITYQDPPSLPADEMMDIVNKVRAHIKKN